jgi:hypothetical protein
MKLGILIMKLYGSDENQAVVLARSLSSLARVNAHPMRASTRHVTASVGLTTTRTVNLFQPLRDGLNALNLDGRIDQGYSRLLAK